MKGLIYLYTSPSGKHYIGQTIQESIRRTTFLNPKKNYCKHGTSAIDNARRKYGPKAFTYEVLIEVNFKDILELDTLEINYIKQYNSYNSGYNSTLGGGSRAGHTWTEQQRQNISGKNSKHYGMKMAYSDKLKLRKPIVVLNKNDIFVIEYNSIKTAALKLNLDKSNICKVLNNKLITSGGYKFQYKCDYVALHNNIQN